MWKRPSAADGRGGKDGSTSRAMGEAAGLSTNEINRRLKQIADDTVLDEI